MLLVSLHTKFMLLILDAFETGRHNPYATIMELEYSIMFMHLFSISYNAMVERYNDCYFTSCAKLWTRAN